MKTQRVRLCAAVIAAATLLCDRPASADVITNALSHLEYRSIGPAISGGRTTAVAGSDIDQHLYYAGGAGGGVFKSIDGGSSWSPVFDSADVAPVGAIAIAPHDVNDVWVGTGEANPRNTVEQGDGIWHSRDGGKTWKHMGLDDAGSISNISIDPRDPNRIVVSVLGQIFRDNAMRGMYLTTDGGAHWKRTLFIDAAHGASDVVRVPDRPQTLFAGMYYLRRKPWTMASGGPNGGIFRSDDGGSTWRKIPAANTWGDTVGRIGLAAATGGRIYAIVQSKNGDLWRSDDGGTTWKLMPHSYLVGGRRFYFDRIFVDPLNRNKVIDVGLILHMSTNGGRSFKTIASNAGWDYHHVWWSHDGKRVAVGSDEGVIMSGDGGEHWRQPYALPFSQPYHIGLDDAQPNYHVCFGLQDNSAWCGMSNSDSGVGVLDRDWWTVAPGDGMWSLYDPKDPHYVWSTSTNSGTGQVYLYDSRTQQAFEVSPFARINGGEPGKNLHYRFNWDSPIAFTADGKALVGGNVVFASSDRGQHWSVISPDLTRNDKSHQQIPGGAVDEDMSGAEMADTLLDIETTKADDKLIWASTDDGLVQVTRDGGAHWRNVTPAAMPQWARVPTVEPGRFNGGVAFVAAERHMTGDEQPYLFMTRDYGASWTSIVGDMPKHLFVRSIRQDPKNTNLLYAGTQRGMYASWDLGRHWHSLRLNMPATAIYDIQIHPRTNDLVIASHGRGVWVLDDLTPLQQLQSASGSQVFLFRTREATRWWRWSPVNYFTNGTPANQFVGPNVGYGALITYYLPKHFKPGPSVEIVDAHGRVVRHLSGKDVPNKPGLNRFAWDLAEDGPTKWNGTFELNKGPAAGAEVLPGTYLVRLRAGGETKEQHVTVVADPRDAATPEQYRLRHDTLAELYGELDGVDKMLNSIDKRLKTAHGARALALVTFKRRLTYNPRNDEDLGGPNGVRERLNDLISRVGSTSFQAPNEPQQREAADIKAAYERMTVEYRAL